MSWKFPLFFFLWRSPETSWKSDNIAGWKSRITQPLTGYYGDGVVRDRIEFDTSYVKWIVGFNLSRFISGLNELPLQLSRITRKGWKSPSCDQVAFMFSYLFIIHYLYYTERIFWWLWSFLFAFSSTDVKAAGKPDCCWVWQQSRTLQNSNSFYTVINSSANLDLVISGI